MESIHANQQDCWQLRRAPTTRPRYTLLVSISIYHTHREHAPLQLAPPPSPAPQALKLSNCNSRAMALKYSHSQTCWILVLVRPVLFSAPNGGLAPQGGHSATVPVFSAINGILPAARSCLPKLLDIVRIRPSFPCDVLCRVILPHSSAWVTGLWDTAAPTLVYVRCFSWTRYEMDCLCRSRR